MNNRNHEIVQSLAHSILAIRRLDQFGCLVLSVTSIDTGVPTIAVEDRRSTLHGDLCDSIFVAGGITRTFTCEIERCRIEWIVREEFDRRKTARTHAPAGAS